MKHTPGVTQAFLFTPPVTIFLTRIISLRKGSAVNHPATGTSYPSSPGFVVGQNHCWAPSILTPQKESPTLTLFVSLGNRWPANSCSYAWAAPGLTHTISSTSENLLVRGTDPMNFLPLLANTPGLLRALLWDGAGAVGPQRGRLCSWL